MTAFALISDLFKPKTFAGLFGAAPSVALASLLLTIDLKGAETAAINARSMVLGALALMVYSATIGTLLLRWQSRTALVSLGGLAGWLAVAVVLWWGVLS